jgi:hypothetical protein
MTVGGRDILQKPRSGRLAVDVDQPGRVARPNGDLKTIQRKREASPQELDECFFSGPTVVKRLRAVLFRDGEQIAALCRREEPPGNALHVFNWPNPFYVDPNLTIQAQSEKDHLFGMRNIEVYLRSALQFRLSVWPVSKFDLCGFCIHAVAKYDPEETSGNDERFPMPRIFEAGGPLLLIRRQQPVKISLRVLRRGQCAEDQMDLFT